MRIQKNGKTIEYNRTEYIRIHYYNRIEHIIYLRTMEVIEYNGTNIPNRASYPFGDSETS